MRQALPWLSQGDLFNDVPIVLTELDAAAQARARVLHGPAMLLTHDCALDKASNKGVPKIERIAFLPLVLVDLQDANRKALLRRNSLEPFEVLYLANVPPYGEAFVALSESYYLPARYFALHRTTSLHAEAESEMSYSHATQMDTRMGRLEEAELHLLRAKMNGYWTRTVPRQEQPVGPTVASAVRDLAVASAGAAVEAMSDLRTAAGRLLPWA